ncbi:lamin tail domain-containing protein [Polaromonas sp.]|nr:lamin tail domain-containing protein [Candidatus Saccharibacteria bacterium]
MKRILTFSVTIALCLILSLGSAISLSIAAATVVNAPTPAVPSALAIAEIKVTGDEFIVLQNNTTADIQDLSRYSLKSFNNTNPSASGVTSASQSLPAVTLGQGQQLLLSAGVRPTCGASLAGKLSLSLVDGGGYLQVLNTAATNTNPVVVDSVSWSSSAVSDIQSVPSSTKSPGAVYYRFNSGTAYTWQLATLDASSSCRLNVQLAGGTTTTSVTTTTLLASADSAPATIISSGVASSSQSTPSESSLPEPDRGLLIPEITELLPNPNGSGNDATEEYIELYNPNDTEFELSGFRLQSGITTLHDFTFSSGAILAPKSFASYFAADTGLSLSNNGSRVQLLDPSGAILIVTESYGTARDGQSWALANGHWYWSLTPTPGAANTVTLPAVVSKAAPKAVTPLKSAAVEKPTKTKLSAKHTTAKPSKTPKAPKAAKKAKPKKVKTDKPKPINVTPTAASVSARPIQTRVVALVAGIAVLYGLYEYRADLANGIYKLRTKFGASRANRG